MYKIIRNLHLALGLLVTPFLLIYAISSVFYSHHILDFSTTETTVEEFTLTSGMKNPAEIADILLRKHKIRGTLRSSSISDLGIMKLEVSRPGSFYTIKLDTNSGIVSSEQKTKDAAGFIKALHQAGFRNKNAVESWWSFAITVVSVLVIFIVITGILLWTYRTKDRLSGGIFLFINIVYCLTVLFVLRLG